jgi:lysyl-tRNA synthetase class 2
MANAESAPAEVMEDKSPEHSRREKLRRIEELGHDPWGGRFDGHSPIGEIRGRENEIVVEELPEPAAGDEGGRRRSPAQHGPKVRAAGRVVGMHRKGKLVFLKIRDWTGTIQLFIGKNQVGDEAWELVECIDYGDIVGADGEFKRTNTGELTIFVEEIHFLTKSVEPHPEKYHGITDPELRQRMRYLDMVYTEGVMERFLDRTKIVQSVRATLAADGYVEVEGPTLHSIAGGAAARPFNTHHNALDVPLFMRIALELHLKRLMVGGMERVYELGRVYRNEGIDQTHNPEFTMLEVYQAYGDYGTMMDLTERLVVDAARSIGEELVLPYGETTIDFTPPFERKTYDELFGEHVGVAADDEAAILAVAARRGIGTTDVHVDVIKNELFEQMVEDHLLGPLFVIDYPASMCPLTKRKRDNHAIAERFELFIQGMEVANAYTELNDPDLQEELFRTQLGGLREEDSMAKMDHDFVRALRHGMPPAGGLGIGIDRLVMLLTDTRSIRDVILFPLLRPEAHAQ